MSYAGDAKECGELRWAPIGDGFIAMKGSFKVGLITPLAADPSTWSYAVDGIDCKTFAKARGHVKGERAAKAAVQRAWRRFLDQAGLWPPYPKF